jgi:hypothetical protein
MGAVLAPIGPFGGVFLLCFAVSGFIERGMFARTALATARTIKAAGVARPVL